MDIVYIETSIISHATAWPSKNPAVAVLQDQAKRWLETEASKYRLVTSQFVIDEASRGDPDAAKRRLKELQNVGLLLPDPEIEAIAEKILLGCLMPSKAKLDALHVASAVLAGVDYLLTQNCRHIANATELPRLYRLLEDLQLPRILICTPAQFLGDPDDDI
ncbi:MAG: type II toxin-antitoxin system VapC family toxin [Pirellula sp.]